MARPLIGATLLGLLALVALGSRSGAWGDDDGPREISPVAVDYAMTIGLIVIVGLLLVAVLNIRAMKGQMKLERVSGLRSLILFLAVFTALGYIGLNNFRLRPNEEEENDEVFGPPKPLEREEARLRRDRRSPELQWWLVVAAGIAGGAAVIL
ncbi:MAG TPA: hypothetical protein VE444_00885, partial [Gaiellaceae bacterium]|nr:hypothetical protein [Gaiellaceae bacterium]